MRIYLTGFMGAGKTAVGAALAKLLGYPFVDLDQAIETRAGLQVREIFAQHGETYFRGLEHTCLESTAELDPAVVATGGGTMSQPANRALIARLGIAVWLNPGFAVIAQRVVGQKREDRPLFRDELQAWQLYHQRLPAYKTAELNVDIKGDETVDEVAAKIAFLLRGRLCDT